MAISIGNYGALQDCKSVGGFGTTTTSFTPTQAPRAIVVTVACNTATDQTTGVTYGGVPLARVGGIRDLSIWFLGSGIPSGTQSVVVTRTSGALHTSMVYAAFAAADTAVLVSGIDESPSANQYGPSLVVPSAKVTAMFGCQWTFAGSAPTYNTTDLYSLGTGSSGNNRWSVNCRKAIYTGDGSAYGGFWWNNAVASPAAWAVVAIAEGAPQPLTLPLLDAGPALYEPLVWGDSPKHPVGTATLSNAPSGSVSPSAPVGTAEIGDTPR